MEEYAEHNSEEIFRGFWEDDRYIKVKINPYEAFTEKMQWDKQLQVFKKFFLLAKWELSLSDNSLAEKVMLWILSSLLTDEKGNLSEDRYYCKGIAFIQQIDAGVCPPEIQRVIVPALMEAFPNLQFIISSSASEIGTGEGVASTIRMGAKLLTLE